MNSHLGLTVQLSESFESATTRVTEALKAEGFGVLTEIDVKETMKKKLGVDLSPYKILGACNPTIAFMGLQRHLELGLLLPCNVIVYEEGDGSVVSIQDPAEMLGVAKNPELEEVATIARGHLERVIAALEGK